MEKFSLKPEWQKNIALLLFLGTTVMTSMPQEVYSQDRNQAWQFTRQNRASIAALIRDVEKPDNAVSQVSGNAGYTNLVCGKDGQASASGNTTCVILNNSHGAIQVGQDSQGNQSATSQNEVAPPSGADEILATLNGSP